MESTDSSTGAAQQPNLPPGFRFHPTDEELVVHYLKKKATSAPLPVAIIAEVDLYKFDPWELPAMATFGEQEWYFFSPRDRKYPNGARPNRAATSGYWKATGTDKPVLASGSTQKVGVKKALVFYGGKPPKGIKTNWIMHEYRLTDNKTNNRPPGCDYGKKNSLRLDEWVLCRIYKKNNNHRPMDHEREDSMEGIMIGHIPPSIRAMSEGHEHLRLHLPRSMASNYNALLENDHHNLLEGLIANDGINNAMSHNLASSSKSSKLDHQFPVLQTNSLPVKRTMPSLFWNDDDEGPASSSKRLQLDNDNDNDGDGGVAEGGRTHDQGNSNSSASLATLLSQLPQTPPHLHQQPTLGSLYQLPGMNWYS